jgi:ATP-dependent DNA helicase RecG
MSPITRVFLLLSRIGLNPHNVADTSAQNYLAKFKSATRKEIDDLLQGKLSDALTSEQKLKKISNLITHMRRSGKIINAGSRKSPFWKIAE